MCIIDNFFIEIIKKYFLLLIYNIRLLKKPKYEKKCLFEQVTYQRALEHKWKNINIQVIYIKGNRFYLKFSKKNTH